MLNLIMFFYCSAECHCADRRYAECRGATQKTYHCSHVYTWQNLQSAWWLLENKSMTI